MAKRSVLLKAAALVSSVTLVAGLVSHQAGAFPWHLLKPASDEPSVDDVELVIGEDFAPPGGPRLRPLRNAGPAPAPAPTFFGGSKSIVLPFRQDAQPKTLESPPPSEAPVAIVAPPLKSPK